MLATEAMWSTVATAEVFSDIDTPEDLRRLEVVIDQATSVQRPRARSGSCGRTGVKMEALTAYAIAALAVVGACISNGVVASIEDLTLCEKAGGRYGTWRRPLDGVRPPLPPMLHNREAQ